MIPVYAKQDITSATNRNKVYARQGESLFIFKRDTDTIVFVMTESGNRFSCHIDQLTNLKPSKNDNQKIQKLSQRK